MQKNSRAHYPRNFNVNYVLRNMPLAFSYYFTGSCLGVITGFLLFFLDRSLMAYILEVWLQRLTVGIKYLGGQQTLWFIVNNIAALMLVVIASVMMFQFILRRKVPRFARRFKYTERRNPMITLYSAYMIPIGALMINGFLISLFLAYVELSYGFDRFISAVMLMMPHGMTEIIALLIASSLGLAYLKILAPMIRKGQVDRAISAGKSMLKSKATFLLIGIIMLLIVFSGFIEGILSYFAV